MIANITNHLLIKEDASPRPQKAISQSVIQSVVNSVTQLVDSPIGELASLIIYLAGELSCRGYH